MYTDTDKRIPVGGCSIRYREMGNGPVLLLVHGIAGFIEEWEQAMEILSKNYRVIALDMPGHGYSEKPNIAYTMHQLTDYLRDFILTLNLKKIFVAGHSLGGAVCLNLVIKYPELVSRFILINSAFIKIPVPLRLGSFGFLSKLIRKIPMFMVKASARKSFYKKEFITNDWLTMAYRFINEPGVLKTMFSILHSNLSLSGFQKSFLSFYMKGIKKITVSVLILYGEKDKILPCKNSILLHEHLQGSQLVRVENCGHALHCENFQTFCEKAYAFLSFSEDNTGEQSPS